MSHRVLAAPVREVVKKGEVRAAAVADESSAEGSAVLGLGPARLEVESRREELVAALSTTSRQRSSRGRASKTSTARHLPT